ncbi:MAG: 8-amino-7-oxononanoate synthase [Chloroflexi bacterium]|nr:8-amino-7-oxononanoate synthase [Chloroflexota bacterium]
MDSTLQMELDLWKRQGLERKLRRTDESSGCHVRMDGRTVLSLGSNNYLGLADDPEVRATAAAALDRLGLGAGGSRLTTGNYPEHEELEALIADWKGTADAVLFDSGYAANTGVIPALAGPYDLILSDQLNHASLIDGCRLSRAHIRVYRHGDVESARSMLYDREQFQRCLVVTDGVFSMDGDLAPLPALCDFAEANDAWLVVDDAHGTGVLGPHGAGTEAHLGVAERIPVRIGTLSKAVGASGGFVAGSRPLCEFLRHRARSFVFSTAMPPAVAAGAIAGVKIVRGADDRRQRLQHAAMEIRRLFQEHGYTVPEGCTAIIPVLVGEADAAVRLSNALLELDVFIPAIRYPAVPAGQARLRVTASAALTDADLDWLKKALSHVPRK